MIRWIGNVSRDAVASGIHSDLGTHCMLIQITDPAGSFPRPMHKFAETHQFEFLDAEDEDGFPDEAKCSDQQAQQLVELLRRAYASHMNVLVHCHAGICRSGAVVEVATLMGFTATERWRQPNLRVKHRMMRVMGMTYDSAPD